MSLIIDENNIPSHIAIILDGNGRWAKKRGLPRFLGHKEGFKNIFRVADFISNMGIEVFSCFCFSTENWKRPKDEVDFLMKMPVRYFKKLKKKIINSNYKIRISGRKGVIPTDLKEVFLDLEESTKNNSGLIINICFDYGSYDEITTAVKSICNKVLNKEISVDDITSDLIEDNLYTKGLPKLDLLIRTSGEQRISNFMLWQLAYAELYFTDVHWPSFNEEELKKAILSYQNRNRRFGGLKEKE